MAQYLANWSLIERDEAQIRQLCSAAGIEDGQVEITKDDTGLALLVQVNGA